MTEVRGTRRMVLRVFGPIELGLSQYSNCVPIFARLGPSGKWQGLHDDASGAGARKSLGSGVNARTRAGVQNNVNKYAASGGRMLETLVRTRSSPPDRSSLPKGDSGVVDEAANEDHPPVVLFDQYVSRVAGVNAPREN
jgi:hypothetical protein